MAMKDLILLFITVFTFSSCSNDTNEITTQDLIFFETEDIYGEWELVKETSAFILPIVVRTGGDMQWQETYIFNSNGTFVKTSLRNGAVLDASGTFEFSESDFNSDEKSNRLSIITTFLTGKEIASACSERELLRFDNNRMINSSYNACDGPSLEYEKKVR